MSVERARVGGAEQLDLWPATARMASMHAGWMAFGSRIFGSFPTTSCIVSW
jgi:hypothetical protein